MPLLPSTQASYPQSSKWNICGYQTPPFSNDFLLPCPTQSSKVLARWLQVTVAGWKSRGGRQFPLDDKFSRSFGSLKYISRVVCFAIVFLVFVEGNTEKLCSVSTQAHTATVGLGLGTQQRKFTLEKLFFSFIGYRFDWLNVLSFKFNHLEYLFFFVKACICLNIEFAL